jgi:HAD superfamily hydrolase (TIGR01509 family)
MLKALLFDLDGTLADTNPLHRLTWAEVLGPRGYNVTWGFYRDNISGRLTPEIVADLLPDLSDEETSEIAGAKEAAFRERAGELEPLAGLRDFVVEGQKRGMRISLVTNAPKENVLTVLHALELDGVFEPLILAEDLDAGKPDPAPYRAALETLEVSADEALAFEDSPSGIASSLAAEIPTVAVASTHEPQDLEYMGVELVVHDFTDPELAVLIDAQG